ncbi:unnamed protein product [Triticum turgidum subsp. durum]|uniref:Uncharacterized protein n=1 Tax=Triticum turgidum subsp. durum TaxID=4567 RepID=A0A9R0RXL9_TRITD|nr:unnamed protein product [Triticum turgidum subsp. durum]
MKTRTEIMISRIYTTKTISMLLHSSKGNSQDAISSHNCVLPWILSLEIVLKCVVSCGRYDPQLHRLSERRQLSARARVSEQRTAAILEQAAAAHEVEAGSEESTELRPPETRARATRKPRPARWNRTPPSWAQPCRASPTRSSSRPMRVHLAKINF